MRKRLFLLVTIIYAKLEYYVAILESLFSRERLNVVFSNEAGESEVEKIAIFAMWQSGCVEKNTLEVLDTLEKNGWWILAVNNRPLNSASVEKIRQHVKVYIERNPGKGRDISAFKCGYEYLINRKACKNLEHALFINDSILVLPDKFDFFLKKMVRDSADVVGVTETTEVHYHLSSWLFCVRQHVFFSDSFRNFWKNYKDLNSRTYSINEGEVGLSRLYSQKSWSVKALYSAEYCARKLEEKGVKFESVLELLPQKTIEMMASKKYDFPCVFEKSISNLFLIFSDRVNQTYLLQLICMAYLGGPFIKKDAIKKQVYGKFQIDKLARRAKGSGTDEIEKLLVNLKCY